MDDMSVYAQLFYFILALFCPPQSYLWVQQLHNLQSSEWLWSWIHTSLKQSELKLNIHDGWIYCRTVVLDCIALASVPNELAPKHICKMFLYPNTPSVMR